MVNKVINVLITGVGGGGVGLQILKSLLLSKLPIRICGTDMSRHSLGLAKVHKDYVVPPARDEGYLAAILDICNNEKIDVIFPGSEPELEVLSGCREEFQRRGIVLAVNSREVIDICMDKKKTFDFFEERRISIPRTKAVDTLNDLDGIDFLPAIIKPYLGGGGSNNTFIAQDREELTFFCKYVLKYGRKPLVQEYIGTPDTEYTVGVLSDEDGSIISTVALKRYIMSALSNRLKVPSLHNKNEILAISSGISQGEIVNDVELIRQCEDLARKLRSVGPINIQCRFVNDTMYPFEINPRFSGTTYMRALVGVNEPELYIRKYVLKETLPDNIMPRTGLVIRGLEERFIPL